MRPNSPSLGKRYEGQLMGYAELIQKLQPLPADMHDDVFDFVEFLAARGGPLARRSASVRAPEI